MKKMLLLLSLLMFAPALAYAAQIVPLWESSMEGWDAQTRLQSETKDSVLFLTLSEPDPSITRKGIQWTPSENDVFIIEYRAHDFSAQQTSGEIFFANKGHGFDENHYLRIPSLTPDGKWRELLVPVKSTIKGGVRQWLDEKTISELRFDVANEAPGIVEIRTFQLLSSWSPAEAFHLGVNSENTYFLKTESFLPSGKQFLRTVVLPEGEYALWAHILDAPPGYERLKGLAVNGTTVTLPDNAPTSEGRQVWRQISKRQGGKLDFTLNDAPSLFFDAILLTNASEATPTDIPTESFGPVKSEMLPPVGPPQQTTQPETTQYNPMQPPQSKDLESHVEMIAGKPRLIVNGKPFYAMIGNDEGRNKKATRESFERAGFNVEALWIDPVGAEQWWTGPSQFNFTPADAKINDDLLHNPDMLIMPIIWTAPPQWWQNLHPEETAQFSDSTQWPYYKSTPSFSSVKWREDATEAITAFVKHIESSPCAGHILGYWIIGGVSAEWQGWGCHASHEQNHLMDYSAPAENGFREFLEKKYPGIAIESPATPSLEERLTTELGVFRDPAKAQRCIDYNAYYSESVVDTLLNCTAAAKNACARKKIVGAYFGYSFEYANMNWCMQMGGHNALRKALDSPDVDFFSGPQSYALRRIGETVGWMWPFSSIQNAGKLVWPDDDTRTHLSGQCDYSATVNQEQSQGVIRRNFGKTLCRLCPQCFLPINSGLELDDPALAQDIQKIKVAGRFCVEHNVGRQAEIAIVIDEDSIKNLAYDKTSNPSGDYDFNYTQTGDVAPYERRVNAVMGDLLSYQRDRIERIGAPIDYILFSDIAKLDMNYKFYIMLDCFQYDETTLEAVRKKLYAKPSVVLWCYAPGFIHNNIADPANMEALTGIKLAIAQNTSSPKTVLENFTTQFCDGKVQNTYFGVDYPVSPLFTCIDDQAHTLGRYCCSGAPSLAVKQIDNAWSIFCGSNKTPTDLLQAFAKAAGVHIYTDAMDPMDANNQFIMIHAAESGEKKIHLKEPTDIVDIFDGAVIGKNVNEATISLKAGHTSILFTGPSEEFLQ